MPRCDVIADARTDRGCIGLTDWVVDYSPTNSGPDHGHTDRTSGSRHNFCSSAPASPRADTTLFRSANVATDLGSADNHCSSNDDADHRADVDESNDCSPDDGDTDIEEPGAFDAKFADQS